MKMRHLLGIGLVSGLFMAGAPAGAVPYTVDTTASKIAFSGQQSGTPFEGVFEKWTAVIDFNPAHLAKSSIDVTIDTESATTGSKIYDGTLPEEDWFNVKQFPTAHFKSTKITAEKDGSYKAVGDLTIRDITKPVSFIFKIDDVKKPQVIATSTFTINRLDYHIGLSSDAKAEWVGKDIAIALHISATKTPD